MNGVAKLGLIGLGGVAEAHLAAYAGLPSARVVAAAEPRAQRGAELAARYGFKAYTDHRDMLEREQLDLVCALPPARAHAGVVADCAAAGVAVLCEKPLAADLAAAQGMVDTCAAAGVPLFYGASYRFLPAVRRARELIRDGAIGKPLLLTESVVGGRGPDARQVLSTAHYPSGGMGGSGMGLVDHGVHLIDSFSWLLDRPVTAVFGRGNRSGEALGTEFAWLSFAGGAHGQLLYNDGTWGANLPAEGLFSWGSAWTPDGLIPGGRWQAEPGCIRVHGERGAMRIFHYANELYLFTENGAERLPLMDRPPPAHFALQLDSVLRCLREGTPPEVPGDHGLKAMRVLEALYRSMDAGSVMLLPETADA